MTNYFTSIKALGSCLWKRKFLKGPDHITHTLFPTICSAQEIAEHIIDAHWCSRDYNFLFFRRLLAVAILCTTGGLYFFSLTEFLFLTKCFLLLGLRINNSKYNVKSQLNTQATFKASFWILVSAHGYLVILCHVQTGVVQKILLSSKLHPRFSLKSEKQLFGKVCVSLSFCWRLETDSRISTADWKKTRQPSVSKAIW